MGYELRRQPGGNQALYHTESGETMHPGAGPWVEANSLYLAGTGLEAKLLSRPRTLGSRSVGGAREDAKADPGVVVFDVGLGGAANAMAALILHQRLHHEGKAVRPLKIVSFEHDPEAPRFALDHAAELGYLRGNEDVLEDVLDSGAATLPGGFTWEVRWGDFPQLILEEPERADVVFFDPYSPHGNPALWSLATLESVYRCRRIHGELVLATYSAAYGIRAAMLLAGFFVGEGPQPNPRRRTTVASTTLGSLAQPLRGDWLSRWRRDHEPWPPLTAPEHYPRLRKALLAHSQWEILGAAKPEGGTEEELPKARPWRGKVPVPGQTWPQHPPKPGSRRHRARMRDALKAPATETAMGEASWTEEEAPRKQPALSHKKTRPVKARPAA